MVFCTFLSILPEFSYSEHGLQFVRHSAIRTPAEDLSFDYAPFVHTNVPYYTMLILKLNRRLTKGGTVVWADMRLGNFLW